jgi:sugar lactone lactonase YvrE
MDCGLIAMTSLKAERLVATQMELGECPVWDGTRSMLFWMDIVGKQLHARRWSDGKQTSFALPALGGGLALAADGSLVAGLQTGLHRFDPESGNLLFIAAPEPDKPDNRINEMKCDPEGRIWFGTMSTLGRIPTGALWRMDRSASFTCIFHPVTVPNCLAWLPSQNRFLFTDSVLKTIWVCSYDPASGDVTERSIFADCSHYRGIPDGCAFDEEGCVWVAEFGGGCIRRYDPAGRVVGTVTVPATQVTTCGFAGPHLDKLVIVTAKRLLDDEQRGQQPESGNIFVCAPPARGAPTAMADPRVLKGASQPAKIH